MYFRGMIQVTIIGTGNVARHLFTAISSNPALHLVQVVGRNRKALSYFENKTAIQIGFDNLADSDVFIISISDDHIPAVSEQIKDCKGLVVHTSGSVSLKALKHHAKSGVLYPLQTFSKDRKLDFKEIPICIETDQKEDYSLLQKLANCISDKVIEISSGQRQYLHLAAVFVNNFTNHLYQIGTDICEKQQIDSDLLKPLLFETAKKIENLSPHQAQTGPARRKDKHTMEAHLKLLENPYHKEIYTLLSNSIKETYGEEL